MQQRSSTDIGHKNTKRTERVYDRLPLQTQGQTPIMYIFYLTFDCIANRESFDVAYRVMDFMRDNNLKPSKALIEEYRQSKTNKTLNSWFPSFELLKKELLMYKLTYDKTKKKYKSKIIKMK